MIIQILLNCYLIITVMSVMIMDFHLHFILPVKEVLVDIVDLLLRNNCNINQCQPRTNQSPLITACHRNKEAVAKLLLSYEACDVNIID